jgi:hypothetical protein
MIFYVPYALSQIVLVHISLYLGTSSTQRTSESFRSFFWPDNTFLANSVVMSRAGGQYLTMMKVFQKENYF